MASGRNSTLYIEVTSNLINRTWQHKNNVVEGFTKNYEVHQVVGHEPHNNMKSAMIREKALKKWNRIWKLRLIEEFNPEWQDLYNQLT